MDLQFCSKSVCRTQVKDYCEDGSSKFVHAFTKCYKDLYEEVQQRVSPNLQSDNIEAKEEAKSL